MEESGPAIRALGHLFKLTRVHLWDDAALDVGGGLSTQLDKPICKEIVCSNEDLSFDEFSGLAENLELSRQMNDLGLPLSFQTNKERRARTTRGKRKDPKKKSLYLQQDINDETIDLITFMDENITSADIGDSVSIPGQNGLSCPDNAVNTEEVSQLANGGDAFTTPNSEVSNLRPNCDLIGDSSCLLERYTELNLSPSVDDESCSGSSMVEDSYVHGRMELYENRQDHGVAMDCAGCEALQNDVKADIMCASEATVCSQSMEMVDYYKVDSECDGVFGDWRACWDDYYMRTYFYNIITQDSTWELPPGVTDLKIPRAFNCSAELAVEIERSKVDFADSGESVELGDSCVPQPRLDMAKESMSDKGSSGEPCNESRKSGLLAESWSKTSSKKKKNKLRKLKSEGILPSPNEDCQIRGSFEEMLPSINKYWFQRYLLFSRFDEGIQMDEEGWFSVTPERIAVHHAMRCEGGVTIDCFTGVGGNAIQFAKRSQHVIAIDIDPRKIDYAWHNAAIYGVEDHIDFVRGDCFLLASQLKADTVFLSPPWGGPDYSKVKIFDMNLMLQPHDGCFLFNIAKQIAPKVVMFLPRNVDVNQLAEIAMSANPPWSLEVEKNYLNGKLKAITAYFIKPVSASTP